MKELTPEEMASFDGKDGRPAYIAAQGRVHDVSASRLWSKGLHMNRHTAGKDLSRELSAAPHGTEVFDRYPPVGTLRKEGAEELKHLPAFLQELLLRFPMMRRHPHPMIVHFPLALLMASSLFILLFLFFPRPSFETTGFALLLLGAISSPFAIATGLLTWWVNYRLKLTSFVKRKIQLSILLLLLEIVLIVWRSSSSELWLHTMNPVYALFMLVLSPIVGLLGYYGGQMTFPMEDYGE